MDGLMATSGVGPHHAGAELERILASSTSSTTAAGDIFVWL